MFYTGGSLLFKIGKEVHKLLLLEDSLKLSIYNIKTEGI